MCFIINQFVCAPTHITLDAKLAQMIGSSTALGESFRQQPVGRSGQIHPTQTDEVDTYAASRAFFSDPKEDQKKFAWLVVESFRKAKEPLAQASHMDLNALARAYGMLGDTHGCLKTLSLVFRRHEVPDNHDINVVIAAMARRHSTRAAFAVEGMLARGVKPDAVTFGTVIHEALADGDTEVAGHMIKLAQSVGIQSLTPQSIASVVQMAMRAVERRKNGAHDANGETIRGYLEKAYKLIASGVHAEYLQSASMVEKCIAASLRADDGEMALRFWKLVKDRIKLDSSKQRRMRGLIARKLRQHCAQGRIGTEEGSRMVRELGASIDHV